MAEKPQTDISRLLARKDVDVNLQVKTPEDEQEKALRLHKERWSFYTKEVAVWVLAPVFIVIAWVLCLWMVVGADWSTTEKEWARTGFMAIVSGAVGVYFGKQLGKS